MQNEPKKADEFKGLLDKLQEDQAESILINRDEAPMTVFEIPETGMRIIPKRERNAQGKWQVTSGARKMLQELLEDTQKNFQD